MMRVYLPATLPLLSTALDAGQFEVDVAYAVTPALREWYVEGDIEQLEYAAAAAAARESLQLLADSAAGEVSARRVVVAADVPDGVAPRPAPDLGRAAVRLAAAVPLSQVVSAYVDSASAQDDVRRAVSALGPARDGNEDARFVVDSVEDHELAWYAAQELGVLVELET
jgi:hypothetical protein